MTPPTLLDLPTESLLNIQGSLTYASRLALRLTCRDLCFGVENPYCATDELFREHTNPIQPTTRVYNISDLLEIELWPEHNAAQFGSAQSKQPMCKLDYFACHICLKIRCASQFSNAMMKGKRGKLGEGTIADKAGRFCIPCGLTHGRYQRGVSFQLGGVFGGYGFVCRKCGGFKRVEVGCDARVTQKICTACQ